MFKNYDVFNHHFFLVYIFVENDVSYGSQVSQSLRGDLDVPHHPTSSPVIMPLTSLGPDNDGCSWLWKHGLRWVGSGSYVGFMWDFMWIWCGFPWVFCGFHQLKGWFYLGAVRLHGMMHHGNDYNGYINPFGNWFYVIQLWIESFGFIGLSEHGIMALLMIKSPIWVSTATHGRVETAKIGRWTGKTWEELNQLSFAELTSKNHDFTCFSHQKKCRIWVQKVSSRPQRDSQTLQASMGFRFPGQWTGGPCPAETTSELGEKTGAGASATNGWDVCSTQTGWWLGKNPSEKYERQLGWLATQYMGK